MTEASLDDFFAKKDKTKKKSKSKLTPDELLDRQQEETSLKKLKKKKKKQESAEGGDKNEKKEDEEWIDYVNEEEKDLSGLRIKELQITREEEEAGKQEEEEQEEDEDGEPSERREGSAGPWNRTQPDSSGGPAQPVTPEPVPEPEPEPEEKSPSEPAKPMKYVPPSLRGSAAAGPVITPVSLAAQRRKKKEAPNLRSEEDFPTLGGEAPPAREAPARDFTKVKMGGKQTEDSSSKGPQLELGNRYNALQSS
ncbi:protein CDV3 homolog [Lingula anatina]|uniref:Protein CDV3 homolog n=1 Tax=Lingula anatina TaxID=7574 RepID=A0A1S3IMX8_LINAN|nr:protein CDV3 homolog [Lingula anatina]|eukprot:XP_013399590.1 protein CDV3 homolog [Lingula anatina]